MTVRLLKPYAQRPANSLATFDASVEAGLIAANKASADLTGGFKYFAPRPGLTLQTKQIAVGSVTLKMEEQTAVVLPEGQVLLLTGAPGTVGQASQLDSVLGGTNSVKSWAIGAGPLSQIGPFVGMQKVLITCSAGSIDGVVQDAAVSSPSVQATLSGAAIADPVSGVLYPLTYPKSLPKLAAIGDSITDRNHTVTGVLSTKNAYGFLTWACVFLNQRIQWEKAGNFGVSGDTTTQMLARLQACYDYAADFYCVHGGTNDVNGITNFANAQVAFTTITSNLATIYTKLLSRGAYVIALLILPRSATMTTAKSQLLERVNNWIRDWVAAHPRMLLADANPVMADQASATGAELPGVLSDQLHPAPTGGMRMGRVIADLVSPYLPLYPKRYVSPTDLYDATLNPTGNLLINGCLTNSTAVSGAGVGGTRPASWTAERPSGTGTGAFTSRARADGQPGYEVEIATNLTAQSVQELYGLKQQVLALPSNFAPGDVLYAECEVSVPASVKCTGVMLRVVEFDGAAGFTYMDMYPVSQDMPNAAWAGTLRTPLITVRPYIGPAAAYIEVRLQCQYDATSAASGAPVFSNVKLKKVV